MLRARSKALRRTSVIAVAAVAAAFLGLAPGGAEIEGRAQAHSESPPGAYQGGQQHVPNLTGSSQTDECLETVTEDGSTAGTWTADCTSNARSGSYALYYTFTLSGAAEVTIGMESDQDTYLYIREGAGRDGTILYENDDIERAVNTNSLIRETLATGTYTIEATTYGAAVTGEFTLTILGLVTNGASPPEGECVETLFQGGEIAGMWTADCVSSARIKGYARYYTFTIREEAELSISAVSEEDTYLFLREGLGRDGAILHENDDIELGVITNSRIQETLEPGDYTIEVTTYNAAVIGAFTLIVSGLSGEFTPSPEPPQLPDDECLESVTQDGDLSGNWTSDCASESKPGSYARYFAFSITGPAELTITLESDEDPYLFLREGIGRDGAVLFENDDILSGSNTNSRVQEVLEAGSYTIEATTYSARVTGSFTLTISGFSDDRAALTALYNATGGPNWTENTGWLSEAPIGEWSNVIVDEAGRVTHLYLDENQLTGELPAELGDLTNLKELRLGINRLSGEIPAELGNLAGLTHLYLYGNQLNGEIPSELGNLAGLIHLFLYGNRLNGEIPWELGNLAGLTVLALEDNQLNGEIPSELGDLASLNDLTLSRNSLSGEIPAELGNLGSLTLLALNSNELSGEIPSELGNLASLTHLYLDNNELSGEISPELGNLTNLELLNIENNELRGEIPSELGDLASLNDLRLSRNSLSEEIPAELGNPDSLTVLLLHNNDLSGEIPPELGNLASLTHLYLNNNELSGEIPSELGNLGSLTALALNDNRLSGEIPPELGNPGSLTVLLLHNNELSGEIPPELGNLGSLTLLLLYNNELSGEIPLELGNLTSLTGLALNDNRLSGEIPPELGNLGSLTLLALRNNELSGEIPSELGDLASLTVLALNDNRLSGEIPSELGNLGSLTLLYLHNNELRGEIPSEVLALPDLQTMYIAGSGLSPVLDEYPPEKAVLTSLFDSTGGSDWTDNDNWSSEEPVYQWFGIGIDAGGRVSAIRLTENNLKGTLPADLGNLSGLLGLYLSDNLLTGEIPPELGSLSMLISLYLNDNQLTGEIPSELGDIETLEYLYLRGNDFTGCIPHGLRFISYRGHDLLDLGLEFCPAENSEGQSRFKDFNGVSLPQGRYGITDFAGYERVAPYDVTDNREDSVVP